MRDLNTAASGRNGFLAEGGGVAADPPSMAAAAATPETAGPSVAGIKNASASARRELPASLLAPSPAPTPAPIPTGPYSTASARRAVLPASPRRPALAVPAPRPRLRELGVGADAGSSSYTAHSADASRAGTEIAAAAIALDTKSHAASSSPAAAPSPSSVCALRPPRQESAPMPLAGAAAAAVRRWLGGGSGSTGRKYPDCDDASVVWPAAPKRCRCGPNAPRMRRCAAAVLVGRRDSLAAGDTVALTAATRGAAALLSASLEPLVRDADGTGGELTSPPMPPPGLRGEGDNTEGARDGSGPPAISSAPRYVSPRRAYAPPPPPRSLFNASAAAAGDGSCSTAASGPLMPQRTCEAPATPCDTTHANSAALSRSSSGTRRTTSRCANAGFSALGAEAMSTQAEAVSPRRVGRRGSSIESHSRGLSTRTSRHSHKCAVAVLWCRDTHWFDTNTKLGNGRPRARRNQACMDDSRQRGGWLASCAGACGAGCV